MLQVSVLDVLRVIGRQRREQQHADSRDCKHQCRRGQEDIHDRGNDQTDHAHHQEGAEARQVFLRGVAVQRQRGKGDCRDQEGLRNRHAREHQEDRADRQAHQGGIGVEVQLRPRNRQPVLHGPEAEDHDQRCEHDKPFQRAGVNRRAEPGQVAVRPDLNRALYRHARHRHAGHSPGDQTGQQHANGHQPVNLVHMGAKARIDLRGPGPDTSRADRLIVSHVKPPMLSLWADPLNYPPHDAVYRGTLHAFQGLRREKQNAPCRIFSRWARAAGCAVFDVRMGKIFPSGRCVLARVSLREQPIRQGAFPS